MSGPDPVREVEGAWVAGEAERFTRALKQLHEDAGSPSYARIKARGTSRSQSVVADSTWDGWLSKGVVPASSEDFATMVAVLESLVVKPGHRRRSAAEWGRLQTGAQAERNAGRGRPAAHESGQQPLDHARKTAYQRSSANQHRQASVNGQRLTYSAYLRQVERIAPPRLDGRKSELAELARFCMEERPDPFVWWRAEAWAGKSALLSTFVLHPPESLAAGRVHLVSFFITARLASQDTREAFIAAVTEQLCALLGVDVPAGAGEAVFFDLLDQAAQACQVQGGRLVLVVDGLDEDRGVTTGPEARSIAGLLPGRPPAGMRVIVAGRPNPPIPDDVPDWHPLRDDGIVRLLGDSPHARDLQRLGQSELKRLLRGSGLEQDLLGLLTAARGGLSGPDFRELTGADLVEVEEILHTVAGRTFTRRLANWRPDDRAQVYLLGHEELHNAAYHYLGPGRLAGYSDRLHAWAEDYRAPADSSMPWPAHTPEYLLTGYPRMLATAGDTHRLTALAIDPSRHDRMLDLSGGDTAALTEITVCQNLHLDCPEPDLYALARLSYHRRQLQSRNAHIPIGLPAVWGTLGRPNRAEALARAITDPGGQARALAEVAKAVAEAGDDERARRLAGDAEQIARAITDPGGQTWALAEVARVVAEAGDRERARRLAGDAEQIARAITDPGWQVRALAEVARAVAEAGDHERAEQIARAITDPGWQVRALAEVAKGVAKAGNDGRAQQIARALTDPGWQGWALAEVARVVAEAGDRERARRLAGDAEQIVRAVTDPGWQVRALAEVARAVAEAGDHERAEQIARAITDPGGQARALAEVAKAVAEAGDHERAEQIARAITDPGWQGWALAAVARAVAEAGDRERARRLAGDAEQIVRAITDPGWRAETLAEVARVVAEAGDHERAEQIARAITNPNEEAQALVEVAKVVAEAGDHERARRLAGDAEQIVRAITDPNEEVRALAEVARAVAEAGDHERAEQIARAITDPGGQARALAEVARGVAKAGNDGRAEQIARAITDPGWQGWALAAVARAVAEAGDRERARRLAGDAEQIVRAVTDPGWQVRALAEVARAVAEAGDHERAEQIARAITDPGGQARALAEVAKAVAEAGDHERAEQIARAITDPGWQGWALAAVARAVAEAGDRERARRLAGDAEQIVRAIDPGWQARALAEVAKAVAEAGDHERAEQIARTLTDPGGQARALAEVAKAVAEAGDHERARRLAGDAEQIVRAITDPDEEARALAEVARAVAEAGDHERAEQIARAITNPNEEAQALAEVAKVVGLPRAGRLLGEVFVLGSWLTPLSALAKILPQEIVRIADVICTGASTRHAESSALVGIRHQPAGQRD